MLDRIQEYQARRAALAATIQEGSIAIIPSAQEIIRNGDAHYRFRQDSNFYYLTGFQEPDAILVIMGGASADSILFHRAKNPEQEQWTGPRLGQAEAAAHLGVHTAFPNTAFETQLPELLAGKIRVYYPWGQRPAIQKCIEHAIQACKARVRQRIQAPDMLCDLLPVLGAMRLFKSPSELVAIKKAVDISVAAHGAAMRHARTCQWEYELEAILAYEMIRAGSRAPAYDMIVGSGARACILHYTANTGRLAPDTLVLIDAGAEYENYAGDITRTFPVGGRFSTAQKAVYALVLQAQQAAIALIKPGIPFAAIQETIVHIMTEGLLSLGILNGSLETLIATQAYKPYYMHQSGHWLGLDVHDAGAYQVDGQERRLAPGMVLTVEPGLYLSANIPGLAPQWHDIGIRIEDDIVVTETGCDNLSAALPRGVDAIEALMCE